MVDNVELLPCPFCGEQEMLIVPELQPDGAYDPTGEVTCGGCCTIGPNRDAAGQRADARERWNTRLSPAPEGVDARELLASACEPWADYNGDLPDYDHPLRPVYESGVQYVVELLAKELGVKDWTPCDGTEEFDGDLGGTLMNIVLEAMPKDEHGDPIYPRELPALLSRPPAVRMREALENIAKRKTGGPFKAGQLRAEHRSMIETARAALTPPPKGQNDHG